MSCNMDTTMWLQMCRLEKKQKTTYVLYMKRAYNDVDNRDGHKLILKNVHCMCECVGEFSNWQILWKEKGNR